MKYINFFFYGSIFIYAFLICLNPKLASVFLGLIFATALLKIIPKFNTYSPNHFQKRIVLLTPILFFILTLISFLFTTDDYLTFKSLGKKVWFVFLPIFFIWLNPRVLIKIKEYSLYALTLGAFLSSIYLLINIMLLHYNLNNAWVFDASILDFYHTGFQFTAPLQIHPTYLGMYILLALAYVLIEKPFRRKYISVIFNVIVIVTLLFIASRVVYALVLLLLLLVLVQTLIKILQKNKLKGLVMLLLIFLVVFLSFSALNKTYIGYRLTKEAYWDLTSEHFNQKNLISKQDSRLSRWKVAVDLIKKKPFLGYGAGTEKLHLVREYQQRDMKLAAEQRYGAHNQFISYFLEFGIIGILVFITFLISNILIALAHKHFLAVFFFTSLFFLSMFENIFYNDAGIIFIAFFSTLFTYLSLNQNMNG